MSVQIMRHCFTVDDYYRMAETGILSEDDRVELIEGEVITMSPIGSRHAACVDRLNHILNHLAELNVIVRVQSPVRLSDISEPQPDITLLRPRQDFYRNAHPTPSDVLLIIEVADSSVELDREVKLPVYAQAMIPEVWIVNLPDEAVEVYSRPAGSSYHGFQAIRRSETVRSSNVSNLSLEVDSILG